MLKRMVRGTYVAVEPFHLDRYEDERSTVPNEEGVNSGEGERFLHLSEN